MIQTTHQRPGQAASAAQHTRPQYTANRFSEQASTPAIVVIEKGIQPYALPSHLNSLPRQYFSPDDCLRISGWPTVSGSEVALVLSDTTPSEKAAVTHLLYGIGALRVDTYRVEVSA